MWELTLIVLDIISPFKQEILRKTFDNDVMLIGTM